MEDTKKYIENVYSSVLEVNVYYNIGGMNYFTGQNMRRGYYIAVTPVTIGRNAEGKIQSVGFTMFAGKCKFLLETKRKSDKAMAQAIELAKAEEAQLIEYTVVKNKLERLEVSEEKPNFTT